ncbi:PrpR N-terminal domain-containing protein [Geomicrobium sp. JCM 19055]|uniref:PrpR N-terminal domain-containing protein n=1 Tax=Geomicrobium sp. JCM 19055 TaxID=1460649 RepID=UPI00045ECC49|nr:PrpR N-terminal domain-containing protein [Geomicrobium sp. JCM 19055]GAK00569.1 hypothetical protein JCM19055_3665 [Geomicrobium sp. JCM 19055]
MHSDKYELEKVFQLKINQYHYQDSEGAEHLIRELKRQGQLIVIGSGLITNLAKQNGMNGILWYGKESIHQAVSIAFNLLQSRFEELKSFKQEEYILKRFHEGVVIVNERGRITNINEKARQLLELASYPDPHGTPILRLFTNSEMSNLLISTKEVKDKIIRYKKKLLFINILPIFINERFNGTVAIFSDIDELQKK